MHRARHETVTLAFTRPRDTREVMVEPVSEELEVLRVVSGRLDAAGIPYMVTGSMALNYYAMPRMTRDIDLVIELAARDADRMCDLFREDFYLEDEVVREAIERRDAFNLIHTKLVVKVDVMVRKEGEYRRTEFARRRSVSLGGQQLFIVAPEDLIISKLDWARGSRSDVQLADVRNLMQAVPELDRTYLEQWVMRLGLEGLYREVGG
jgi:hypothetical protein